MTADLAVPVSSADWLVTEDGFDPARASYHETIFTVGNGRSGTRGSLEEGHLGARSGSFLAGVYDHHDAPVTDLVNCPDWLHTLIWVGGQRLDPDSAEIVEHRRQLDLQTGLLHRRTVYRDPAGRRTQLESVRSASVADRDLLSLRLVVTPLDHDAPIRVLTGIDGDRRNLERLPGYPEGTTFDWSNRWEKWALSTHLRETGRGFTDDGVGWLRARTIESEIDLGYALTVITSAPAQQVSAHQYVGFEVTGEGGTPLQIDKLVSVATSRDPGRDEDVTDSAVAAVHRARSDGLDAIIAASNAAWAETWLDTDCVVTGDEHAAQALRFGIYHLLISANPDDPTVNIGAKSLSGEGYRGHVFWDTEVMMLPFFTLTQPDTSRALLGYRSHTLPGALRLAAANGSEGARYPWESAATGDEECPTHTNDGVNRIWPREEEIHVSADVAYGILRYADATDDESQLLESGAEVIFRTAQFWQSRCTPDPTGDGLSILQVMGPDEFHSHVDDNFFTNRLARWHLEQAADLYDRLADRHPDRLAEIAAIAGVDADQAEGWCAAAAKIRCASDPDAGLIEQFAGYFERDDVAITTWDANNMPKYPEGYHHHNCEETMLLKQPDVVMAMFMFPDWYSLDTVRANYDFYEARTLHKSSLSPSIHAVVGLRVGAREMADQYFARSAYVDLDDNQGNTAEGMHIASAGGTWQLTVSGYGGFSTTGGRPCFRPSLPAAWERLRFSIRWRGSRIVADLGHEESTFELQTGVDQLQIEVNGDEVLLRQGEPTVVSHRES